MTTTARPPARTGWRRRSAALAGLLVVGLVTLVVAPASTASAGRNTSAVKIDNKTDGATLYLVESRVLNRLYSDLPGWQDGGTPNYGDTVAPRRSAHYELLTESYRTIEGYVRWEIRNAAGQKVGDVTSTTIVDGESWFSYGAATNRCSVTGPFTCLANGRDTVTVRDREYVEIGNRTTKLSFRLTGVASETGLEPRPTEDLMRPGDKSTVSLNPNFGRLSKAFFTYTAFDANGKQVGVARFEVTVTPEGEHSANCTAREGDYKCFSDGSDRVLFLDLSARPPAR